MRNIHRLVIAVLTVVFLMCVFTACSEDPSKYEDSVVLTPAEIYTTDDGYYYAKAVDDVTYVVFEDLAQNQRVITTIDWSDYGLSALADHDCSMLLIDNSIFVNIIYQRVGKVNKSGFFQIDTISGEKDLLEMRDFSDWYIVDQNKIFFLTDNEIKIGSLQGNENTHTVKRKVFDFKILGNQIYYNTKNFEFRQCNMVGTNDQAINEESADAYILFGDNLVYIDNSHHAHYLNTSTEDSGQLQTDGVSKNIFEYECSDLYVFDDMLLGISDTNRCYHSKENVCDEIIVFDQKLMAEKSYQYGKVPEEISNERLPYLSSAFSYYPKGQRLIIDTMGHPDTFDFPYYNLDAFHCLDCIHALNISTSDLRSLLETAVSLQRSTSRSFDQPINADGNVVLLNLVDNCLAFDFYSSILNDVHVPGKDILASCSEDIRYGFCVTKYSLFYEGSYMGGGSAYQTGYKYIVVDFTNDSVIDSGTIRGTEAPTAIQKSHTYGIGSLPGLKNVADVFADM